MLFPANMIFFSPLRARTGLTCLFDQESFPISLPGPFLIQSSGRTSRKLQNSFTHCFPVSLPWLDFPSSFWPLAFSVGTSVLTSLFAVVCLPHCPALPIFRLSLWGQGRSNFSLYSYSPEESPGKEKKKKKQAHVKWMSNFGQIAVELVFAVTPLNFVI